VVSIVRACDLSTGTNLFLTTLRLKRAKLPPGIAIPLKAISIDFGGAGLIFEGLRKL
jgi:hypothetical protein